jgi:hypothetical protein
VGLEQHRELVGVTQNGGLAQQQRARDLKAGTTTINAKSGMVTGSATLIVQ